MNAPLGAGALLCIALSFPLAHGQSSLIFDRAFAQHLTPAQLKKIYLACDLASSTTRLEMQEAMKCSVVSEELKQREFGGDFDRMLAWWKTQRRKEEKRTAVRGSP
jgi:hypothetical protein